MMAVMGGPPNRAALDGRRAQQPEHELTRARGLESAMRKVAMIKAGDSEHAHLAIDHCRSQGVLSENLHLKSQSCDAFLNWRVAHKQPLQAGATAAADAKSGQLTGQAGLLGRLEPLECRDHVIAAGQVRAAGVG